MRLVQTLWTRPAYPNRADAMFISLSCVAASQAGHLLTLYTDSDGAHLVDTLGLPYAEVRVTLDEMTVPETMWAAAKLDTYSREASSGVPFIHIDTDVFLFRRLDDRLWKSPLSAQNPESCKYYRTEPGWFTPTELAEVMPRPDKWRAYNLGLFGGSDSAFILDYSLAGLAVAKRFGGAGKLEWANSFFEQALFGKKVAEKDREVDTLLTAGYDKLQAQQLGYVHLMNDKKQAEVVQRCESRLRSICPDVWEKAAAARRCPLYKKSDRTRSRVSGCPVG
jgi:hypothetical protein